MSEFSDYRYVRRWVFETDRYALQCVLIERYQVYPESLFDQTAVAGSSSYITGYYTGYVQLPEVLRTHHLATYDAFHDHGIRVFGGLSYGPDDGGFVGWDSDHPYGPTWTDERADTETETLAAQLAALATEWAAHGPDATLEE